MNEKREALIVAYTMANLGLIDSPGGAEWHRNRWDPRVLLKAVEDAKVIVRCTPDSGVEAIWLGLTK